MRRRDFITLLGSTAAWPLAARAQQPTMPIIGFLSTGSPNALANLVAAFRQGLNEIGYVEHRNVGIEYRWAEGQYDRLPALAAELVRRQVAVIAATGGGPSPQAAKAATATIPIVFHVGGDPVAAGLVASFARPGGNITGVVSLNPELVPKRLELLREVVPTANVIAVLINPRAGNSYLSDLPAAARTLGLQLQVLHASSDRDFDLVFADLVRLKLGALLIGSDPFFNSRIEQLAALALRHRLPAIYQEREFAAAGGLMSYGGSFRDLFRVVGTYTGRILKGEKPADLPVQQATKVELIINLKTAKALGLTVPLALLGRADEVIE
jgi:putative ABC transport system substrate-binding protein